MKDAILRMQRFGKLIQSFVKMEDTGMCLKTDETEIKTKQGVEDTE